MFRVSQVYNRFYRFILRNNAVRLFQVKHPNVMQILKRVPTEKPILKVEWNGGIFQNSGSSRFVRWSAAQ